MDNSSLDKEKTGAGWGDNGHDPQRGRVVHRLGGVFLISAIRLGRAARTAEGR
jgi:hypothetical protein